MPKITYTKSDGTSRVLDVLVGHSVMEGGRDGGIEGIVAECGGACSCSTCHVYIAPDWFGKLPQMEEMEEDMLDFAPRFDPQRSRLSCQLRVTQDLDGLVVIVPDEQA